MHFGDIVCVTKTVSPGHWRDIDDVLWRLLFVNDHEPFLARVSGIKIFVTGKIHEEYLDDVLASRRAYRSLCKGVQFKVYEVRYGMQNRPLYAAPDSLVLSDQSQVFDMPMTAKTPPKVGGVDLSAFGWGTEEDPKQIRKLPSVELREEGWEHDL